MINFLLWPIMLGTIVSSVSKFFILYIGYNKRGNSESKTKVTLFLLSFNNIYSINLVPCCQHMNNKTCLSISHYFEFHLTTKTKRRFRNWRDGLWKWLILHIEVLNILISSYQYNQWIFSKLLWLSICWSIISFFFSALNAQVCPTNFLASSFL